MSDFKSDLHTGQKGESLLLELWPELIRQDGFHFDFLTPDCCALELKTDTYDMQKTDNFFIERWSDLHKKRPGGPFQALGRGASLFAYLYIKNKKCFVFNTVDLIKHVMELENKKQVSLVYIRNVAWTTTGYKIPRDSVKHLILKIL